MRDLKAACTALREQLLAGRLAAPEEIAAYWPGGAENDLRGWRGWQYCKEQYSRIAAKIETRQRDSAHDRAARRAAIFDAIAETAEVVELVAKDEEGNQKTLTVYQKSDVALREVHSINLQLARLIDDYASRANDSIDNLEILVRSLAEQSYQSRVLVWIATTKGTGLPFEEGDRAPKIPDDLATLHGLDFYSIAQAFQRVNVAGFASLESSTVPASRPDWSVFWSGIEAESGIPAPRLMRDRGLLSLVATASEHARGREEAHKRAEQESKNKRAG